MGQLNDPNNAKGENSKQDQSTQEPEKPHGGLSSGNASGFDDVGQGGRETQSHTSSGVTESHDSWRPAGNPLEGDVPTEADGSERPKE